ncbi:MAG: hypothetical protein ACI837_002197 [Crocinitomicaceae bacterium]|jgi:hypothetical protein
MTTSANKSKENSVSDEGQESKNADRSTFQFADKRPETVAQTKLQEMANNSPRALQLKALQEKANNANPSEQQPIQKKGNNTGLPDNLKAGMENLSGISLDDVKVHRNSNKPAQLQAHAYAQGTDIHLGAGQEKHLPHEAWHVVQQKQGRVKPTMQMKGKVNINDDAGLEKEADVMGAKALQGGNFSSSTSKSKSLSELPVQRKEVLQLERQEHKSINGLTHLVSMTGTGHLYNGENWLDNQGKVVQSGDVLLVDMDAAWMSRRGINQQENWQADGELRGSYRWVRVIELNHKKLDEVFYVREEMLKGAYEEIPKKMHSVWVQGDPESNEEARDGIATRQGEDLEGWVNMIWLYKTGVRDFDRGLQSMPMKISMGKFAPLMKKSFVGEMEKWHRSGTMPDWVNRWMPILDWLMAKKSFITMSDIMRMIILYYEGGVYTDVKIKVNPAKSAFKSNPMLLINTANFYNQENWAIMANAGSRMIEDIMVQALHQFPSMDELAEYPENYQEAPGREGKMHVQLHERFGVWNIIERYRHHSYDIDLELVNPRPINSWADAYEDRPKDVIKQEQLGFLRNDLAKLQRELDKHTRNKEQLERSLSIVPNKSYWKQFGLTQEIADALPDSIKSAQREIDFLTLRMDLKQSEIDDLLNPPVEDEHVEDDGVDDDSGDDDLMKRLEALRI